MDLSHRVIILFSFLPSILVWSLGECIAFMLNFPVRCGGITYFFSLYSCRSWFLYFSGKVCIHAQWIFKLPILTANLWIGCLLCRENYCFLYIFSFLNCNFHCPLYYIEKGLLWFSLLCTLCNISWIWVYLKKPSAQ